MKPPGKVTATQPSDLLLEFDSSWSRFDSHVKYPYKAITYQAPHRFWRRSVASHEVITRDRSSDGGSLVCARRRGRAHHLTDTKDHRCLRADRQLERDFDGCGYAHERLGPKQHAGAADVLGSTPAPAFLADRPITDGKLEKEAPGAPRLVLQELG